jgi:hypothetical protein
LLFQFSQSQSGIFASTHSAFAFIPLRAFTPEQEAERLKAEVAKLVSSGAATGREAKQLKLLQEWFDDDRHAQIE